MTQFHASWILLLLGWTAFWTHRFIRDNAPALEAEKECGL